MGVASLRITEYIENAENGKRIAIAILIDHDHFQSNP
jgi:hypothetical protein